MIDFTRVYFAISFITICFLCIQNYIYYKRYRSTCISTNEVASVYQADIARLKSEVESLKKHPNILQVLSDLNRDGAMLRVYRVDPDTVFQWSPNQGKS